MSLFDKKAADAKAAVATPSQGSTPVHKQTEAIATPSQVAELGFDIGDNMDGATPRLPQIGIAHQAQVFKMPDGSKPSSIEGIILDSNTCNAWWEKDFATAGGGNPPECASLNGIKPYTERAEADDCAACPHNKFGSDGGRGKACKNMRRVHVLLSGHEIPYRLTIPPTSLRNWDDFVTMLADIKRHYALQITKVSLTEAKNKEGIAYSQVNFETVEEFNDLSKAKEISELRKKLRDSMQHQEISSEEFASADKGEAF